jgi:hypothetical protein
MKKEKCLVSMIAAPPFPSPPPFGASMRLFRLLVLNSTLVLAVSAFAQIVTCSSDDMGRHFCRANTSGGVQMVRQRSGSACTQNYSWGYDSGGIWVDHGCRADFSLGGSGASQAQTSPNDAMRLCKNTAGERMPQVPLAYISVYRGSDTGSGSYMINFHSQPPGARPASGFCIVSKSGQLQNFQFDPGSGSSGGGNNNGNGGGQTPQDAMRSCKNAVSGRMPNVPLAYIQVDQPTVNGGSLLVNFRVQPPNAARSSGYCDVFKNGRVNLQFR